MAIKAGTQVQLYGAMCQHTNTDTHRCTHTRTQNVIWRTLAHAFVGSGCFVTNVSPVCHRKPSHLFCFFFFLLCFAEPSSNAPDRRNFPQSFLKRAEASTRLAKPVCSKVTGNQPERTTNLGWFLLLSSNSNLPKYLAAL